MSRVDHVKTPSADSCRYGIIMYIEISRGNSTVTTEYPPKTYIALKYGIRKSTYNNDIVVTYMIGQWLPRSTVIIII